MAASSAPGGDLDSEQPRQHGGNGSGASGAAPALPQQQRLPLQRHQRQRSSCLSLSPQWPQAPQNEPSKLYWDAGSATGTQLLLPAAGQPWGLRGATPGVTQRPQLYLFKGKRCVGSVPNTPHPALKVPKPQADAGKSLKNGFFSAHPAPKFCSSLCSGPLQENKELWLPSDAFMAPGVELHSSNSTPELIHCC